MVESLSQEDVYKQRAKSAAFIGSPKECIEMIGDYAAQVGGFDHASLQVNTKLMDADRAAASMRLFAEEVIPKFAG